MDTDSLEIVHQIRQHFENLLRTVVSGTPSDRTADQLERHLFAGVLELGRMLFSAFFLAQADSLKDVETVSVRGKTLPKHARRARTFRTVFGKVRFQRNYYYRSGEGKGYFLLDATLNLPTKPTSDLLREWLLHLAAYNPFHKSVDTLAGILGQCQCTRTLEEDVREDGALVAAFYEQAPSPKAVAEASILVAQADGKGVAILGAGDPNADKVRLSKGEKAGCKKEAIATAVYTIAPCARTPQEVTDSLFKIGVVRDDNRVGPRNKKLWATLQGKAAAIEHLWKQVRGREGETITTRVALTDGCAPLQKRMVETLQGFPLVLDVIHAIEYLWEAGNSLLGEKSPKRVGWVKERVLLMLSGHTRAIIDEFRRLADEPTSKKRAKERLRAVAAYYERCLPYMRYEQYLSSGWPIATGVIEGACRHLIKDRCELSGMRWSLEGAEALLHLRCVAENGDWDAFHNYRKEQRLKMVYAGAVTSKTRSMEDVATESRQTEAKARAA